jgi:hypothetical protein
MENNTVSMHRRAKMQLFQFPPEEQEEITRAIESIADPDPDKWPKGKVSKIDAPAGVVETPGDIYVLRVNPQILVIFQLTGARTVLILDVVLRDKVLAFVPKVG